MVIFGPAVHQGPVNEKKDSVGIAVVLVQFRADSLRSYT
jgi:hypothetical protein